jgi:PelA/Pel-15E family pectate lyase
MKQPPKGRMIRFINIWGIICLQAVLTAETASAQVNNASREQILATMKKATTFFADEVSENGGYVSHYLPGLSRRWGEMEAYPTMIWVQDPGTVGMGNTFLDAYAATGDEFYYQQAARAARALIWGQLPCGGWNYLIDFGGENSLLRWYHTIGKNAWRLEEFQHYYGNATFDDETTVGAAFFLLRIYLTKMDPAYKPALEKVIGFILKSQYPLGGWPQRYPLHHDFEKNGHPDYTSYYTFNDNVGWENLSFLVTCYATLEETRHRDPIRRAAQFFLISQQPAPFSGWTQQYNMDLQPAEARTYEPASLDPQYTAGNAEILLKLYQMTGNCKFLDAVKRAIDWLKTEELRKTDQDGVFIFAKFIDPATGKALYTHRIGSDVRFGHYYFDHDSTRTVAHYGNFRRINLGALEEDYERIRGEDTVDLRRNSPLKPAESDVLRPLDRFREVGAYLQLHHGRRSFVPRTQTVSKIINGLDSKGRWLSTGAYTSHPYTGDPQTGDPNTKAYMTTFVGDKYDTSPYRDTSSQEYISTAVYIRNMHFLMESLADATPEPLTMNTKKTGPGN